MLSEPGHTANLGGRLEQAPAGILEMSSSPSAQ